MTDRIRYRPDIKYTPEKHDAVPLTDISTPKRHDLEVFRDPFPPAADVWRHVVSIQERVYTLLDRIDEAMEDHVTELFDPEALLLLPNAKAKYGDVSPENCMTFDLYKQLLLRPAEDDNWIIIEAYEGEHHGINGKREVELYIDAVDMEDDIDSTSFLAKNILLNLINSNVDASLGNDVVKEHISQIDTVEAEQKKIIRELQNRKEDLETLVRKDEYDPGDAEKLEVTYTKLRRLEDQWRFITEGKDLVLNRASNVEYSTHAAFSILDDEPTSAIRADEVLHHKAGYHDNPLRLKEELSSIMRYACERKTSEGKKLRGQIDNISFSGMRDATDQSVVSALHYKRSVISNIVDWLVSTEDPPHDESALPEETITPFDHIASVIADAIEACGEDYRSSLMSCQSVATSSHSLRETHMKTIADKERFRKIYKIVQSWYTRFK